MRAGTTIDRHEKKEELKNGYHDYDFTGAKTIRVYSVDTVDEVDYDRNKASNRFGDPANLGDTIQEMTCTQEKAFTFTIDPLDNSDQAIEKSAGKALRRQLDERTVPGMDKYRLKKWVMGANIQHKLSAAPTKSTIVEAIIDVNALMTDALVPLEGRTLYIPTQYYKLLKQNPRATSPMASTSSSSTRAPPWTR